MDRFGSPNIVVNDLSIIEYYFDFKEQFKKNITKWINLKYSKLLLRTILLLPWMKYVGFYEPHLPNSYLKKTFNHVWNQEKELLEKTCRNKFRNDLDVNQWIMRYWQLANGDFFPRNPRIGKMFDVSKEFYQITASIENQTYKMICINDSEQIEDIAAMKKALDNSFCSRLSKKSEYEL